MNSSKSITLTELRGNLYQLIDQVIDTGMPLDIERKGHHIKITVEPTSLKTDRLIERPGVIIDPNDDLIHNNWIDEWKPLI